MCQSCTPCWPQAKSVGPTLLQRMMKLHYNFKYKFLRPTIDAVVERYNAKFRPNIAKLLAAKAAVEQPTPATAIVPLPPPLPTPSPA